MLQSCNCHDVPLYTRRLAWKLRERPARKSKIGDCLEIYIRHSRVPLPEIYPSISEVFYPPYTGETGTPDVEVAPELDGVEVGWIAVPTIWEAI